LSYSKTIFIFEVLVAINSNGKKILSVYLRNRFRVSEVEVEREVGPVKLAKVPFKLLII